MRSYGFWSGPEGAAVLRDAAARGLKTGQISQTYHVSRQTIWTASILHGIAFRGAHKRRDSEPQWPCYLISAKEERERYGDRRYDDVAVPASIGRIGATPLNRSVIGCAAAMCAI